MATERKRLSKLDAPKTITSNETILNENDFIVSKTDTKGFIIYCNEIFTDMCGYKAADLIGANGNIISYISVRRKPPRSAIEAVTPV